MAGNDVRLTLTADASQLNSELGKAGTTVEQLGNKAAGAGAGSSKLTGALSGLTGVLATLGVSVGAAALLDWTKETIALAREQARVEGQLAAVIKSTGGAAGVTAEQAKALASQLQGVTNYGDEATIAGEALLLTFTNIGSEVFPQATRTMLDMSTAMGQDLKSSAIQIGKALNDPVEGLSALTRVGVTFSEQQKEQITTMVEAGNIVGAQTAILAELNKEFGGSAEAARQATGEWTSAMNALGDLREVIGAQMIPTINELAVVVRQGAEGWQSAFQSQATITEISERAAKNLGFELKNLNAQFGMGGLTVDKWTQAQQEAAAQLAEESKQTNYVNSQLAIYEAAQRAAAQAATEAAQAASDAAQARADEARQTEQSAAMQQYFGDMTNRQKNALSQMRLGAGQMPEKVAEQQQLVAEAPKIDFSPIVGSARTAAGETKSAFEGAFNQLRSIVEGSVVPTLDQVWKPPEAGQQNIDESARRLATVSTSGFSSEWLTSLNEQFAGLDFWQPIADAMQGGDEGALKAAADDILTNNVTKLWDIEAVKENVRAKLQADNARQAIVDAITQELMAEQGATGGVVAAGMGADAGLIGQVVGDPATVATGITDTLAPAVTTLTDSLAALSGGGMEGGGGTALMPLITDATTLNTMFAETLPASILTEQGALTLAAQTGVVDITTVITTAISFNDWLNTITSAVQTLGSTIVSQMSSATNSFKTAANSITSKLIPAIREASKEFDKMAEAARRAAAASKSAGSSARSSGNNAANFQTGTPLGGFRVPGPAGVPFPVTVHGGELLNVTRSIEVRNQRPGNSNTFYVTINTGEAPNSVAQSLQTLIGLTSSGV